MELEDLEYDLAQKAHDAQGETPRPTAHGRCDHCQHEYLLAFSCKSRWFCPSCHQAWKHSGFNLHAGEQVPPEAKADLEDLAQYILRNPFSVEKMTLESPGDFVIYRSRLNAKINRNFEVFTPTDKQLPNGA